MKEKIYTIPVNEAYDNDCECPMCLLEKQLEDEALEYTLGPAMMEEDFRENSDKTGFCNHHFTMLLRRTNKLPLALILDTHTQRIRKTLSSLEKSAKSIEKSKSGLFRKNGFPAKVSETLRTIEDGCIVCERKNRTMERYADVLLYMWANDDVFRTKFERSKGLCLKHAGILSDAAPKSLKPSQADEFLSALILKEIREFDRIQEDIHRFTEKFDYRNKDMPWGTAKDAPKRTIEKISGYTEEDDPELSL